MTVRSLVSIAALSLALAACSEDAPPERFGSNPDLPEMQRGLFPSMEIADPAGWNGDLPTVPEGFKIEAIATDLKVPRQTLVLPNGDILVAEARPRRPRRCDPRISSPV
jgi:glucose/arabinose dehydrogenase